MMRTINKLVHFSIVVILSVLVISCGSSNGEGTVPPTQSSAPGNTSTVDAPENVVITIGNLTDITGPGSNAVSVIDMALEDAVAHYNEQKLIPGVELEIVTYDGQFDPSNDIPGYEWLKDKGADIIWTPIPSAATTLKPRLEKDVTVAFSLAPNMEVIQPPGYVFSPGSTLCEWQSYTLLKWIAENDPDFPSDRPARIGGAGWNESAGIALFKGAEEYAKANPDQYEWEGGYLIDFTFIWDNEAAALKDCDYLFPAYPSNHFIKAYQQAGGTGKFVGAENHVVFLSQVDDADLWEPMDGMLVIRPSRWWNEEGEFVDLSGQLVHANHMSDADEIVRTGGGYLTTQSVCIMLEAIRETVAEVGPQGFSPEVFYENLKSFSTTIDGCQHSFTETKRTSSDYMGIYELRAADKDLFRADPEWIPVVDVP